MGWGYMMDERYCRWCSSLYHPKKVVGRDGFCSTACRVALYRARKSALRKLTGSSRDDLKMRNKKKSASKKTL